jgi:hypothetical protein
LVGIGLAGASVAADETLPKAERVLDGYTKATGGKAAYDKLENRVTHATFELVNQGIQASLTIYNAKPNRVYTLLESDALGKIEKGTDGDIVWEVATMTGPSIKEGAERADVLREAFQDKYVYWREVFGSAETVGTDEVGGRPCFVVRVSPREGHPQMMCFDRESGLLVKIETTLETAMGKVPVTAFPGDYRKIDGVLLPHDLRIVVMGQERRIKTTAIEHNVQLAADRFDPPAEIAALLENERIAPASTGAAAKD